MGFKFNPLTGQLDLVDNVYDQFSLNLPANSTTQIDNFNLSEFISIDYSLSFKNDAQAKYKGLKLYVTRTDTDVHDQVYARSRGSMAIEVITSVVGSGLVMSVKNNESFAIDAIITRAVL